jgi:hypothetical protein
VAPAPGCSLLAQRMPWWPHSATAWVAANLPPKARVFEFGGGGSTLWLQDQAAVVTTVEHDTQWHAVLAADLPPTATLLLRPPTRSGTVTSDAMSGYFDDYTGSIDGEPGASLDLVIVDGRARVECARRAMQKVRPGGLLLLDDTGRARYQPAVEMLAEWERHVFTGLKAGSIPPAQTSVWRRPVGR